MIDKATEFDITKETTFLKGILPALPKRPRKNLFDILKIQHREIRNSNILAYFFDPNEEHGFGSLFFDSFQEIAIERIAALKRTHPHIVFNDISSLDEVISVCTEEQTNGASETTKSIDIVLEGDDWVIGIENKIHHHITNPLDIYWKHLQSKNRKYTFGIVLSLELYDPQYIEICDSGYFLNITHQELMKRVQNNLQLTGELNSTDLFYLREYFKNIESHYYHLKETPEMDEVVKQVFENYKSISEILEKKNAVEKYIEDEIDYAFKEHNYEKTGKWYRRIDKKFDLYFFVKPASELLEMNAVWLCFEIRNNTNDVVDKSEFVRHFLKVFEKEPNFNQGKLDKYKNHTHAFTYNENEVFSNNVSFKDKFKEILEKLINGENSPVKIVESYLEDRQIFKIN
tara:strand:- start:5995 stop:7197 length:1203 start_codon:yes stop_codon:yes gene_type:complete